MKPPISIKILSISLIISFVISLVAHCFTLYARLSIRVTSFEIDIFNTIQNFIVDIAYISIALVAALAILRGKFWGKVLFISWAIPRFLQLMFKSIMFIRYEEYLLAVANSILFILILIAIYILYRSNSRKYFSEI